MARRASREVLAANLLISGDLSMAARDAGISRATASRWLRNDAEFKEILSRLRAEATTNALGALQKRTAAAVAVLGDLLRPEFKPAVRLGAASRIIDASLRVYELFGLEERMAALEASINHEHE